MMFRLFKNNIQKNIRSLSKTISPLVIKHYNENTSEELLGIHDAEDIIEKFLGQGEYKLAFEHLVYTITDTGFILDKDVKSKFLILGEKLRIDSTSLSKELDGLLVIGLQNLSKALEGEISYYWFENKHINLPLKRYHKIIVHLTSFETIMGYDKNVVNTSIIFDWLDLGIKNPEDLDGIHIYPTDTKYDQNYIYINNAHNPCDIKSFELSKTSIPNEYILDCTLHIDFEHEMVAQNEEFSFVSKLKYIGEIKNG